MKQRAPPFNELLIFLLFLALTCAMTWPWAINLRDALPDTGDPYYNSWMLWWNYHQTFTDPLNLFHANIFYPYRYTLAFSEHAYGLALIFFPLFALGLRPITVHGVAMLTGFAFSGYGAFRLARTLNLPDGAAWLVGIAFAFIPYRFHQISHLNYVFAGWIPLLLEALILFARRQSWKRAAWLGAAFLMNALTCVHWLILTVVPLLASSVFLIAHYKIWRDVRLWLRGAVCVGVASILLLPFLVPYLRVAKLYNFVRSADDVAYHSVRPVHWLTPEPQNKIWGRLGSRDAIAEKALFPGLLIPLLALAALLLAVSRISETKNDVAPGETEAHSNSNRIAAHESLIANTRAHRNFEVLMLGTLWAVIGFAGSFGMNFAFHRLLFEFVPLFRSIRVPARWAMICYLGLAILAGVGAMRCVEVVAQRLPGSTSKRVVLCYALILIALLFEQRTAPLQLTRGAVDPDAVTLKLKATEMRGGIVELPAGGVVNPLYVLRAADHARPLVTGYSGFVPPIENDIEIMTRARPVPDRLLDLFESIPVSYLVVHNSALLPESRLAIEDFLWRAMAAGRLRFVGNYGERDDLYAVVKIEPQAQSESPLPPRVTPRDFVNAANDFSPALPSEYRHAAYFVYRLYKASYGRHPRREELMRDAEAIMRGVTTSDPRWKERLENNKQLFVDEWTRRSAFADAYVGKADEEFTDALFANASSELSKAERSEIVKTTKSDERTRADVLLKVTNDEGFYLREYNTAYVLFMYFIYLERNPDDPPDGDMSGLNFWVDYLHRNGDHGELASIFQTSSERKARFGAR
ncbi:MAG: hypothetical protein H0V27_03845 [Pyrinomonadaceae bacterium]|nr:hypothetical protein [Pyrinomonadaceae bacterium]